MLRAGKVGKRQGKKFEIGERGFLPPNFRKSFNQRHCGKQVKRSSCWEITQTFSGKLSVLQLFSVCFYRGIEAEVQVESSLGSEGVVHKVRFISFGKPGANEETLSGKREDISRCVTCAWSYVFHLALLYQTLKSL